MIRINNHLSRIVAFSLLLTAASVRANLLQAFPEMGDLERWGVFSLGGDVTSTTTVNDHSGSTYVKGDVGVAGAGNINMSGSAIIDGDLYYHTPGTFKTSSTAHITGTAHSDAASDAILDNSVTEAINTSNHAATFASSTVYAGTHNITLGGGSLTLTAQHDRPGNSTVLNLTNFTLSGSATLTLQGTATDLFIINVTNQFSLSGSSRILLSGGLQWDDVLFNVRGSGPDIQISGQSIVMSGILMANNRKTTLSGSTQFFGEVVTNKFVISGGAQLIHPPVTSP
jgi:hypothetical protein